MQDVDLQCRTCTADFFYGIPSDTPDINLPKMDSL